MFPLAHLPLLNSNRECLNMARSAGVLAKPEDGGAYKAYRYYRHLRWVHIREHRWRRYADLWRRHVAITGINLVTQVTLLITCQQSDGELLSLVFLSRRDSHPPDVPRVLFVVCWSAVVPCLVISSIARGETSVVARALIAIDRTVISWCSRVCVKTNRKITKIKIQCCMVGTLGLANRNRFPRSLTSPLR